MIRPLWSAGRLTVQYLRVPRTPGLPVMAQPATVLRHRTPQEMLRRRHLFRARFHWPLPP